MLMAVLLSIGDFSRMTYLSVKALRHYHELGLLVPAEIDPVSGYRFYRPNQVGTAQVIRRFRDLGMPLDDVKAVLEAPDVTVRNAIIVEHLRRVERQLEQAQAAATSLRQLLEQPPQPIEVEYRCAAAARVLAIRDRITMSEGERWWSDAFARLHAAVDATGMRRTGPDGCLYYSDFFTNDTGDVVAFVPVAGEPSAHGDTEPWDIPAAELAVTLHQGSFGDLDQTYGALGTFVAERAIGLDGPIRENYLVTSADTEDETRHRTEVCWPVFQTTTSIN